MFRTSILLASIILLASCSDGKKSERPTSPRIRKETKISSPQQNQRLTIGEAINLVVDPGTATVDSIEVEIDKEKQIHTSLEVTLSNNSSRVGNKRIKVTVFFDGKKETHYPKVIFLPSEAPEEYTYTVVNKYLHDKTDYTQGLLIEKGHLYESTGRNGLSTLEKKGITSGETVQQINLGNDYFGEGIAFIGDQLFQLTYTSGACFVYDRDLNVVNTFSFQGEGWGLCPFEGNLLMTDGSHKIFTRNPATFSIIDELEVYDNNDKIDYLNELEIIDGLIYANVYQEDYVVVVDPDTGAVLQKIDLSGLLSPEESRGVDVLNGIAYEQESDRIFVTGKLWPALFEVRFLPKTQVQ